MSMSREEALQIIKHLKRWMIDESGPHQEAICAVCEVIEGTDIEMPNYACAVAGFGVGIAYGKRLERARRRGQGK